MWENKTSPELPFDASGVQTFPDGFRFTIAGVPYSRVGFNRNSLYAVFIPEGAAPSTFYREIDTPTYYDINDNSVPLEWMAVSPSTANLVRLFCVWCDQFDPHVGTVTYQMFETPESRVFRISMHDFKHFLDDPRVTMSAQISFFEATGMVKVHYVERSLDVLLSGAIGVQMSTSSALNVPNNLQLCPLGVDVFYNLGVALSCLLHACERSADAACLCAVNVLPCASVNCRGHGTCVNGVCFCQDSYWGEYCEVHPPGTSASPLRAPLVAAACNDPWLYMTCCRAFNIFQ
jgi:hypothetical protein